MAANPYAFSGDKKATADSLNAVTADIAARLVALEALGPAIEAAKESLVAIGLQRMNAELFPLIVTEQERVQRGVLIAGSSTPAALVLGATLNLVVDAADRLSFSPSVFVYLARTSTTRDYAVLQTTNWDSGTGIYTGTVTTIGGFPGPWQDWQLGSLAGATLAQLAMLAEVRANRDDAVAGAAQVATDAAQVALDRIDADAAAVSAAANAAVANRIASGLLFTAASTTSAPVALGVVSVVLTPATAVHFAPMARLALISAADGTNALAGNLKSYDPVSGTLTLAVDQATGTGSHADWIVTPALPAFLPAVIDGGDDDAIGAPPAYQSSYVPGDLASIIAVLQSPAFVASLPKAPPIGGGLYNDNGIVTGVLPS